MASRTCKASGRTPPSHLSNARRRSPASRSSPRRKRPRWRSGTAERRVHVGPQHAGRGRQLQRVLVRPGTKVLSTRQTSLVVDPPDGRVPVRPAAEATRDYDLAHWRLLRAHERVGPLHHARHAGRDFPGRLQQRLPDRADPGYVVIFYEMIHDARIIPIDGRPRSRSPALLDGRLARPWEGDTLVIETTNFNNKGWISTSAAGGRIKGIPTPNNFASWNDCRAPPRTRSATR